jgi:hypothetical protein
MNQTLKDNVRRSFFGERERHVLQRLHVHGGEFTRDVVVAPLNSLKQRYFVAHLGCVIQLSL